LEFQDFLEIGFLDSLIILTSIKKRGVSYFYRTATTSYLCYVPVLEDSEGAGRKRLTPHKCR
jgi:hypothetical protein